MIALETLLQRAADAENQTPAERAAAINALSAENGLTVPAWPEPPSGYQWQGIPGAGGRLVRVDAPWWRGGPDDPVRPVEALPKQSDNEAPPVRKVTPRIERLVALVSRPQGATIEEIGGTASSVKVSVSQARQCGFVITFDRAAGCYRIPYKHRGHPTAPMADMVAMPQ